MFEITKVRKSRKFLFFRSSPLPKTNTYLKSCISLKGQQLSHIQNINPCRTAISTLADSLEYQSLWREKADLGRTCNKLGVISAEIRNSENAPSISSHQLAFAVLQSSVFTQETMHVMTLHVDSLPQNPDLRQKAACYSSNIATL